MNDAALKGMREMWEAVNQNDNYPFSDGMVFCSRHNKQSDIIDVDQCSDCFALCVGENFRTTAGNVLQIRGFKPNNRVIVYSVTDERELLLHISQITATGCVKL